MSKPKVSLGSWAFSFGPFEKNPWSFTAVAQYASKNGYDGIEINGCHPHPDPDKYNTSQKCNELVGMLKDLGLGISGYVANFSGLTPSLCERSEYLEVLKKNLFFCEQCDIKLLRVDTGSPPEEKSPEEYKRQFDKLVVNWKAAAEQAKRSGVKLVWEFEPSVWLNKPSEVKLLHDQIDNDHFKVLFDTSHAYMGSVVGSRHTGKIEILPGGINEYAQMLLECIGHIHLIDSNGQLYENATSIHESFGNGLIDFNSVMKVLSPVVSKLDWVCVDFCFNPDTPIVAKAASRFVKKLLNQVCI